MKKLALFIVLAAALILLVPTASAQPSSYNSGFQVQNLSDQTANIVIQFYGKDGAGVVATMNDTIAPNDSNTYFPLGAVSPGFQGSVVISSDQQVAAIANVTADSFAFGASYGGFSAGSGTVSLPLIMKENGGFSTWFNIQNTGSSATTVDVSFDGESCDDSVSIEAGEAATFVQENNGCLPSGYVGAATLTAGSGGSIVATVLETGTQTLFAYNGFTGGSTGLVMPLVQANNADYHTGIQIQNAGTSATDVTVSYTPATAGTACTETQSIPAGSSQTFALNAFSFNFAPTSSDCDHGSTFVGSATVTGNSASEPLVGITNQTTFGDKGSAYNAFDPGSASQTLVMPLIMDDNAGFMTGFNVQNVGSSSATVTCSFSGLDSSFDVSDTLAAGEALNHVQLGNLTPGYVGSATCDAGSGGEIIAVVNELKFGAGDTLFTYEATNTN